MEEPTVAAGGEPGQDAEGAEGGDQDVASDAGDARLQEVTAELDTLRDRYLRTVAEYENFRRRTERERAEGSARAQAQVVEKLLEPLDDLQRVAQFGSETATVEALLEGVRMVERKLQRVLEGAGLETVEAHGKRFDPELHEALMTVPADSRDEDEAVGQVFQPGYQFKGILLRPARVQVKKFGE